MDNLFSAGDQPVLYAIPLFLVAIFLELAIDQYEKKNLYWDKKDAMASIGMGLGSLGIGVVFKFFYLTLYYLLYKTFHIFNFAENQWYAWVLLFFLDDFSFYWHHRLSHEVRVLWAAHVNHHSSQGLNFAIALRQSWAEIVYKYIFWLWLPILGFPPLMILTMMSISLVFQFLQHTQLVGKLGPLEWVFNTPSHHRVHHAKNVRYMDRNHAGMLIIWDRLFGTFEVERENEAPVYGITTNIHTYNLVEIASHEYKALWHDVKSAKNWKDKLRYLFNPPGWSPDGPNQTAKYLQQQLKLQEEQQSSTPPAQTTVQPHAKVAMN